MELKLDELATKSGVPARTIRLYITRGLIPGPLRSGRNAVYSTKHVVALKEIRRLQQKGLSLAEIKQRRTGSAGEGTVPAPVRWSSYQVAPDIVVMVRESTGGWRLKQVHKAISAFSNNLKSREEEDGQNGR